MAKESELRVQTLNGLLVPDFEPANQNGHYFYNQGGLLTAVLVQNTSLANAVTVTVDSQNGAHEDAVFEVLPGETAHLGPFAPPIYNERPYERVYLSLDGGEFGLEAVSLAVVRIGL